MENNKKKFGPLAWVLIGCFGFLILSAIGFTTCTFFVGKKVKNFAENVAENPAKAVEPLIRANPNLELVETNDDGTLTVRDKRTGETVTVDWRDVRDGKFSIETDKGKIEVGSDEGIVVTDNESGEETAYGSAANQDIPDWVPVPEGVEPEVLMSAPDTGLYRATSSVNPQTLGGFYRQRLEAGGYELSVNETPSSVTLHGTDADERQVTVAITPTTDGGSSVRVNWDA